MICLVDSETLVMTERGVELDYCPKCRGVWLDRGELGKIIERGAPEPASAERHRADYDRSDHERGHKPSGVAPCLTSH